MWLDATGALTIEGRSPAKRLDELTPDALQRMDSLEDNRKGGWYAYRASKAALTPLLQTGAIELVRRRPGRVVAALQPGTVHPALSRPLVGDAAMAPAESAQRLLAVLDAQPAHFVDHLGQHMPW